MSYGVEERRKEMSVAVVEGGGGTVEEQRKAVVLYGGGVERESEWGGGLTLTLTITKITGMSEGGRKKKERKVRKNEGKKIINFLINYSECMHDTCPYYLL